MGQMALRAGKVSEVLEGYSFSALKKMAPVLGLALDTAVRKSALVTAMAQRLGSATHLRAARLALSDRQWQALAIPRLAAEGVRLRAVHARLVALGAPEDRAANELAGLLATGCLLLVPARANSRLDVSPEFLTQRWVIQSPVMAVPALFEEAQKRTPTPKVEAASEPTQVQTGNFTDLQREVFLALRQAGEGQIRLTTSGLPYKTSIAKLAGLPPRGARKPSRPESASLSPNPTDDSTLTRLWFVLALLDDPALSQTHDGCMRPEPEAERLLTIPPHQQAQRLYSAWLESVFDEFACIPTLTRPYGRTAELWTPRGGDYVVGQWPPWLHLREARATIVAALRGLMASTPGWVSLPALARAIWTDDPEFLISYGYAEHTAYHYYGYYDDRWQEDEYQGFQRTGKSQREAQLERDRDWAEVEGAYVHQVLTGPLHWLGLVDLGLDAKGQPVSFRLTPLGRHILLGEPFQSETVAADRPTLVVQPSFEVVVLEASANLALVARLDEFAQRKTLDRAAVYQITRESVVRGLERGVSGTAIIDLLEGSARAPLPQNVRYSIEEWVRLYERVHLRRAAALLEANSPAQLERWLADKVLKPLLGQRLGPRAVLVPRDNLSQTQERLRQMGEAPRAFDYSQKPSKVFVVREPAEIEVPLRHDGPYLRYRLGRFADLASQDAKVLHYRLTPQSVKRGAEGGIRALQIVEYLKALAEGPLPADVVVRAKGWSGGYQVFRHAPALAVEAPAGANWEELAAVPAINRLILRRLSAKLVLVGAEDLDKLRAAFAERGIPLEGGMVRSPEGDTSSAEPEKTPEGGRRNFVHVSKVTPSDVRRIWGIDYTDFVPTGNDEIARVARAAIVRRQTLLLLLSDDKGAPLMAEITPLQVERFRGDTYLEGQCAGCHQKHSIVLDQILAVAPRQRVS